MGNVCVVGACEEEKVAPSPVSLAQVTRALRLSEQRGKLKPLMKRPSVLSQEKPRGQWGSGLVACGDPREGEGAGQRPSATSG